MIEETINHLIDRTKGLKRVSVIIVGTEIEREENGENETLNKALKLTQMNPIFEIIEAPLNVRPRSGQCNYSLKHIKTLPAKTWILTLDIDSRLPQEGIYSIIEEINKGTSIMQQSALFLSNFNTLSFIQKGHAFYQSRWTIAHEVKRIKLHNRTGLSIAHIVGHGLCIQIKKLTEFGGFPEDILIDDMNLGFYFVCANQNIKSLTTFEIGDNPSRLIDGLKQEYMWSFGAMHYPIYLYRFMNKFPDYWKQNKFRSIWVTIHGVITYIGWFLTSWVVFIAILLIIQGNIFATIFLSIYIFEYIQCAYYFWKINQISLIDCLFSPLYALLGVLRRSFGANLAFIHTILGTKAQGYKTPHTIKT